MPIKEYQCQNDECKGERIETTLPDVPFCPKCGNRMIWAPKSMTFALKGPGWTPKNGA